MPSLNPKILALITIIILSLPLNFGLGFFLGYKVTANKIENLGPYYLPKEAIVTKVIDGDTVQITSPYNIGFGKDKVSYKEVRYLGINSPDANETNYKEAKIANERLVLGKKIILEYDAPQEDKYGRILAWVWLDGKLINKEMLKTDLAIPFIMEGQKLKYDLYSSPPSKRLP